MTRTGRSFLALAALATMSATVLVPDRTAAQTTAASSCPASGAEGAAERHRRVIVEGWEYGPRDGGRFSFREKLGRYYDWSGADVALYDDFDPEHRVARSAAAYGAIFEPSFNEMRQARHAVTEGPDVTAASGDVTASTLEFVAALEALDGKVTAIRTRSSLVWRCGGDGWRIVREHNSSRIVPTGEVEAVLAR